MDTIRSRALEPNGERKAPTRPDKLTLWPVDDEGFGIDVLYKGADGYRRATVVRKQLEGAGVRTKFRQEVDGSWSVRLGPVGRADVSTVLNGFIW